MESWDDPELNYRPADPQIAMLASPGFGGRQLFIEGFR
jgi:hypothetical protein